MAEKSAAIRIGRPAGWCDWNRVAVVSRGCIMPIFSMLILTEKERPGILIIFCPGSLKKNAKVAVEADVKDSSSAS